VITIRKQVHMSEEGVAVVWHITVEDDSGPIILVHSWFAENWHNAIQAANQIQGQTSDTFLQLSPIGWIKHYVGPDNAETYSLNWLCHTCTVASGERRYGPTPASHLEWHARRLAGSESEYRSDMAELQARRNEDMERSMEGRTDWDYEQRIARLEEELEAARLGKVKPRASWSGTPGG
jgi:hypothetical protein